jgi:5-dehydro-2-deoxygluconokinase
MKAPGFDRHLYILPFDHRNSFQTKLFGWTGTLSPEQTAQITAAKRVVYDAFKAAVASGDVAKERAAILVDEQFGADILRDARKEGYMTACPTEKSGQAEFDFEYGDRFAEHIEAVHPAFSKVLVRYNPEGNAEMNRRQAQRLKRLSDYLHSKSNSLLMIELLVPAEPAQLDRLRGDKREYDRELRPVLMAAAMVQLQDAGFEPDVWKVEGMERRTDCEHIVSIARRDGRNGVSCIVLGRGEDDEKVREWLAAARGVPGFIGFAVGRTSFSEPLQDWRAERITREEAVEAIAWKYAEFTEMFQVRSRAA